jgi:hypothetical protein
MGTLNHPAPPTFTTATMLGLSCMLDDGSTVVCMNSKQSTNNERLRELVEASGLTQAVSLTIFNRGLGTGAYSESAWKAYLSSPETTRFRRIGDDMLAHAEKQFAKISKRA